MNYKLLKSQDRQFLIERTDYPEHDTYTLYIRFYHNNAPYFQAYDYGLIEDRDESWDEIDITECQIAYTNIVASLN